MKFFFTEDAHCAVACRAVEGEKLSDFAEEFKKRNISIHPTAQFNDWCYIGNNVKIGRETKIGNVNIGTDVAIGGGTEVEDGATINNLVSIGTCCVIKADAFISDCAEIRKESYIGVNAFIGDSAKVGHLVTIGHQAQVGANSHIHGLVTVPDGAMLGDGAVIRKSIDIITIGLLGSREEALTAYRSDGKLYVCVDLFEGTLGEFGRAVESVSGNGVHTRRYKAAIKYVEEHFSIRG